MGWERDDSDEEEAGDQKRRLAQKICLFVFFPYVNSSKEEGGSLEKKTKNDKNCMSKQAAFCHFVFMPVLRILGILQ